MSILPWIQMVLFSILISWCFFPGLSQTKKKSSWNSSMLEKNSIHAVFFSESTDTPWQCFQKLSRVPCRNQLLALGQSIWQPGWRFSRFSTGSQRFFSVTIDGKKYFKPHSCWWRGNLLSRVLMGNYGTTFPQCFGCELVNLCRLWKPMACVGLSM